MQSTARHRLSSAAQEAAFVVLTADYRILR